MQDEENTIYCQDVTLQKKELRKKIKVFLKEYCMDKNQTEADAEKAANIFLGSKLYNEADIVFAYGATSMELSVDKIIIAAMKAGKKVALPKSDLDSSAMSFYFLDNRFDFQSQLIAGAYGIREPKDFLPCADDALMTEKVVFLIPGLAFSFNGERLGHGKGYYDYYLSKIFTKNKNLFLQNSLVGFCYDFQLLESLPVEAHDILVSMVITPTQIKKIC